MNNEFPFPDSVKTLVDLKVFCAWLRVWRTTRRPVTKQEAEKILQLAPQADRLLRRLQAEIALTSLGAFARHDLDRLNEFYEAADKSTVSLSECLEDVPL